MLIYIPIKEKSQRVPNKNFRELMGESLYKLCLLKLENHSVFVDTDSTKIINEIRNDKRLGHVTPFMRHEPLCGHRISVCDLIKSFIIDNSIEDKTICQIHVTSPFLTIDTIKDAACFMEKHDSVVSCNQYQNRLWRKEEYGFCPVNHNPSKLEQTQDLPIFYEENSLFYIFNSSVFLKSGSRIGANPYFYSCSFPESIDIDTEDDWSLCVSIGN